MLVMTPSQLDLLASPVAHASSVMSVRSVAHIFEQLPSKGMLIPRRSGVSWTSRLPRTRRRKAEECRIHVFFSALL